MQDSVSEPKPRGRPRSFDREAALDRAVELFWREGYEGATVAALCRATGLNPPSLYAAFGDKRRLWEAALDRYQARFGGFGPLALDTAPTAREGVERMLLGAAESLARPEGPRGCLVVTGALACADEDARAAAASRRTTTLAALLNRLARGQADGDVSGNVDAESLARYVATVFHGMSIQARDGATAAELQAVARLAMRAWPDR
jgi:TetR/AcrR family transcriptional regulator, copper-responsive repressor